MNKNYNSKGAPNGKNSVNDAVSRSKQSSRDFGSSIHESATSNNNNINNNINDNNDDYIHSSSTLNSSSKGSAGLFKSNTFGTKGSVVNRSDVKESGTNESGTKGALYEPWCWPPISLGDLIHIDHTNEQLHVEIMDNMNFVSTLEVCRWFVSYKIPSGIVINNLQFYSSEELIDLYNKQQLMMEPKNSDKIFASDVHIEDEKVPPDGCLFPYKRIFLDKRKCEGKENEGIRKLGQQFADTVSEKFNVGDPVYIYKHNIKKKWLCGRVQVRGMFTLFYKIWYTTIQGEGEPKLRR